MLHRVSQLQSVPRRLLAGGEPQGGLAALRARLGDRHRYERQIDRLHQRHMSDGGLWTITQQGVGLGSVVMQRGKVARMLARAVSRGEYTLGPARLRSVRVGGKDRTVFRYDLFDLIVHGVVADILSEAITPTLSPQLYSYRTGVSWLDGVSAFAGYARAHHRARPDPRSRGLYVLRRDVAAYTDSIRVDDASAIWGQIIDVLHLDEDAIADAPAPWPVVRDVVRASVLEDDGSIRTMAVGVPTGQPIASVAFNLYLRDLDHEMAAVPGAFYGRYSDDLLFAHPDPGIVRGIAARLDERVGDYDLELKAEKGLDLYLSGAGRPSFEWPEAKGTGTVTFVGMSVALDGTVTLGGKKMKRFLREARRRSENAARATAGLGDDQRGRAVVASLNGLLDSRDAALQGAPAPLLASAVTDRGQLDWLDHELALIVARQVSGRNDAAAFRSVPYRRIRSEWGLRSTRRARDLGARSTKARAAAKR